MEKRIKLGSWDKISHEPVSIVPVSSHGFTTNDKHAFMEKRASNNIFTDKIASVELKPGDIPIHAIAIGATETYGCNSNGDGFTAQTCRDTHPTFVKHARYYRHHPKEKGVDKSYGLIKLSAFNEDMQRVELLIIGNGTKEAADRNGGKVMPDATIERIMNNTGVPWSMGCSIPYDVCFTAGTLIATEYGYRPIEEIQLSDSVWTHEGRLRSVNHIYHNWSNNVGTLKASGLPEFEGVTGNHPFYVVKKSQMRGDCLGTVNGQPIRHTQFSGTICGRCNQHVELTPDWVPAEEIEEGDFLVMRKDACTGRTFYAGDFGYMLGIYLGDGFISYSRKRSSDVYSELDDKIGGITIACNANQPEILESIKQAWKTISDGSCECYKEGLNPEGVEKQGIAVNLTDRELALRIKKFGNEYCRTKRLHEEIFRWSDKEKADVIAGLIDSDGYINTKTGSVTICTINKGLILDLQRLCFNLNVPASAELHTRSSSGYSEGLETVCWRLSLPASCINLFNRSVKVSTWLADNEISSKAATTALIMYKEWVLLPVSSGWSRIEAENGLTRVYNLRVSEDSTYIANGVIVHNCDSCHNKAASSKDYCTEHTCVSRKTGQKMFGCASGLGKIAHTGELQYVDNPNPVFKDMSEVTVPADRTAYGWRADYMDKKASYTDVIGGAELHNLINVESDSPIVNVIDKLAELEDFDGCYSINDEIIKVAYQGHKQPEQLVNNIVKLSDNLKWSALMKYAGQGVILSPSNFLTVYRQKYAQYEPGKLVNSVIRLHSGIYNYINSYVDIHSKVASIASSRDVPNSLIWNNDVTSLIKKEAISRDNVQLWVKYATINNYGQRQEIGSISDLFALPAAVDYALYKAAALLFLPEVLSNKEQLILWS